MPSEKLYSAEPLLTGLKPTPNGPERSMPREYRPPEPLSPAGPPSPARKQSQTLHIALVLVLIALSSGLAVWSAHIFTQFAPLQAANERLTADLKHLKTQIADLESQNTYLTDEIEKAQKEKKNLKDGLEALKRDHESAVFELQKAQQRATAAEDEKSTLEDMLLRKSKEMESFKSGAAAINRPADSEASYTQRADQINAEIRKKDEEIQRLTEQNQILTDRLDRLYKTTSEKMAAINVAKITLEETIAEARRKIDQDWTTVDLGSITANPASPAGVSEAARPSIKKEGRVLAVNDEHGFVVVDLGKVHNIKSDTVFSVTRGAQKIATLHVLETRDVMTACNVAQIENGKKISVGDVILVAS